jgi:signal transduction histidine kinase/tetratricopeptide (TPR) repeat protein
MIRSSLYTRIAIGFMLVIALVLGAQTAVFLWLIDRRDEPNYLELTSRLAGELSHALQANPALDLSERVARLDPREAVFVIMKNGTVAGRRKPPPVAVVESVNQNFVGPIDDAILRSWVRSQYRGVPLIVDDAVVGVLGIVPLTPLERFGPEIVAIGAVLLIAGALVGAILIVGPVRSRLQELRGAAGRLGSGDLTARAREAGRDEVAELARAFNAMADELQHRAAALQASDRARQQLIADVSHELMTPLTAILGHLETLSMTEVRLDDAKRQHQVAVTIREAKRLERLIDDLLDLARLKAGGGELDIQTIETHDLFEQVAAHHEHDCRQRNVQLVSTVERGAETLTADPFRLEQAVENVTANAMRHTPPGGIIRLRAERSGGSIVLTVSDSGEGIAPEHLPHIFDRFYKTASARGMASRGSGLGLSIVKAVVERHNGRVSATSTVGEGTTIRIELPAAAATTADVESRPSVLTAGRKARSDPAGAALIALFVLPAATASAQERVTFSEHVAPILYKRCVICHRPAGQAPFSLMTFDDARQRATLIAQAALTRYMPPWKPDAPSGTFIGERRLADDEITLLARWAQAGAPEGDPAALPPAPRWSEWQLGTPDLIVTLPEYTLRPDGLDVFRNFVLPIPGRGVRHVRGVEFRPGSSAVHHANIRVDYTDTGDRMDQADPGPGYEGVIPRTASYPDGHFLGWTPGQVPPVAPKDLAWRLDEQGRFVVQLHMRPTGKLETIRPAIGLYFTERASKPADAGPAGEGGPQSPVMLRLGRQNIDIPAGEAGYHSVDEYTIPVDVQIHALQPHSHYRATRVRASATLPDRSVRELMSIPEWDFGWQDVYRLAAPLWLPAGTRIRTEYVFDNSASNRRNPESPPKRARWGFKSSDEMGDVWIQVMTRTETDRITLIRDFRPKDAAEEAIGYEMQIEVAPGNASLHDDAALLYLELGKPEQALAHFDASARLRPGSASAVYNVGTALEAAGRLNDASAKYEAAIKLDASYAPPLVSLGTVRLMQGRAADALALFTDAVRLQPDNADARNNLGRLLFAQGKTDEAIDHLRAALAAQPGLVAAHFNLAGALLQGRNDAPGAIVHFREAIRLRPEWTPARIALSWVLSSHPDAAIRRPAEAIELARQAVDLTSRDPSALDALAAGLAADGRFDEALAAASDAAAIARQAGATQQAAGIERRLALYRARKAWVEEIK